MFASLGAKLAGLGAVLLVILSLVSYGAIQHSRAESALAQEAVYKADLTQAASVNQADIAALAQYKTLQAKYDAVEAAEATQSQSASTLAGNLVGAALAAPAAQNGAVSSVLLATLDALRTAP